MENCRFYCIFQLAYYCFRSIRVKADWLFSLESAISLPYVNVIGHLGPEESFDLTDEELIELSQLLKSNNKTIEVNAKYRRPPMKWLQIFKENNRQTKRKTFFKLD